MSATLEWRHLRPADLQKLDALSPFDYNGVSIILLEADAACSKDIQIFTAPLVRTNSQRGILLDLAFHVLRFARSLHMTHVKQSTLVSLLLELHRVSMTNHLSPSAAYARLEELLLVHSVQRPPHGLAVFRLDETRAIAEYCTATYFRFYTLYLHSFTHRRELTVTATLLGDGAVETLPTSLPPLVAATPLAVYKANEAEKQRILEEAAQRKREAQEEEEHVAAEEARRRAEAEDAARREVPQGLRAQLLAVKHQVGRSSTEYLNALEQKVQALEARMMSENLVLPGGGGMGGGAGGAGGNAAAASAAAAGGKTGSSSGGKKPRR